MKNVKGLLLALAALLALRGGLDQGPPVGAVNELF
jgi:hypothetical protein